MALLQFDITNIYDDLTIDVTDICRETGTVLNTNLQSYRDIPLKQLFRKLNLETIPKEFFGTTEVVENSFDKLSLRIYDNPNYWWLILLINRIENPFTFNMSPRMIAIVANYLFRTQGKYTEETYFDLVNEHNYNKKKSISYIKKQYLNDFFRRILS
jgi:hypothetical protein